MQNASPIPHPLALRTNATPCRRTTSTSALCALSLAAALLFPFAKTNASIIVSEPFSGYVAGQADSQSAKGTNLKGLWGATFVKSTFISSGLAFSSMNIFGGALQITATGSVGTETNQAQVTLGPGVGTVTGDLWLSLLVRPELAVSSGTFLIANLGSINFGTNASSSLYLGGTTDSAISADLIAGQTFLYLAHLTNVGTAATTHGSMSVLSAAQYADWKTGGGTEAQLLARAVGIGSSQRWASTETNSAGPSALGAGGLLTFQSNGAPFTTGTVTFDQLNMATTLNEVAQVPEPSALLLLTATGLPLLARRRRG